MIPVLPVWMRIIKTLKDHKISGEKDFIFVSDLFKRMQPVSLCQVQKVVNDLERQKFIKTVKKERKKFIILTEKGEKSITF